MPAAPAAKNFPLSGAAQDLGLGDMVRQQLADDLEERLKKKKLMAGAGQVAGSASMSLFPGVGGVTNYGAAGSLLGG